MRCDPAQDLHDAGSPRVNDPRLPQDVQLLRRAGECRLAVLDQLGESFVARDSAGGELLGLLG